VKKGRPRIPAGAPGHPRTGAEPSRRAFDDPRRPSEGARRGRPSERAADPAASREREEPRLRGGPRRQERARLVYEDDDILAYDKPAGLPVIAAEGSRARSLLDQATEQVRRSNPKGRAAVVHRIDRDTSGIVVFARSAAVKKELMGDWSELVSERRYVALVQGSMGAASGVCDSWLKENRAGEVYRTKAGERGAKRALTRWKVVGEGSGLSLLELFLETGRKHQIRVHLADSGHPVVGDPRYGRGDGRGRGGPEASSARVDLGRLCLHAASIELAWPGRPALRIESPAPPEFAAALGRRASRDDGEGPVSGRRASSSASPSAGRSGVRPRPAAPRVKKPRSRP
jgi:23S rRNA pseudouridine1911/1915/1917 synthase